MVGGGQQAGLEYTSNARKGCILTLFYLFSSMFPSLALCSHLLLCVPSVVPISRLHDPLIVLKPPSSLSLPFGSAGWSALRQVRQWQGKGKRLHTKERGKQIEEGREDREGKGGGYCGNCQWIVSQFLGRVLRPSSRVRCETEPLCLLAERSGRGRRCIQRLRPWCVIPGQRSVEMAEFRPKYEQLAML